MPSSESPVVFVTGVSSGIGLALARRLWKSPYRTVVTLRKQSLSKLATEEFHETDRFLIRAMDITNDDERAKTVEEILWRWGSIDVLINNAGISYRAVVEHMTDEEEVHQLETNYLGPMGLIRLVLPKMRENRRGKIINISSVSGMMAMPTMSSYSASKFALEGASESLWYELRPWDIDVTLVQPGFVHSGSFKNVYFSKRSAACDLNADPYCRYYTDMGPFIERLMNWSLTSADDIARRIVRMIGKRHVPLRVPVTVDAKIFFWLRRLLPRWIYHKILYLSLPGAKNWARVPQESKK